MRHSIFVTCNQGSKKLGAAKIPDEYLLVCYPIFPLNLLVAPPTQGTWRSNDYVSAVRLVDGWLYYIEWAEERIYTVQG